MMTDYYAGSFLPDEPLKFSHYTNPDNKSIDFY